MTREDLPLGAAERANPGPPLRILMVTNMFPQDGHWRGMWVHEQLESLRALGHHVDLEIVAQKRGRRDYFLAAPRLRRVVQRGGYDVVHIHYGMTALSGRLIPRHVPRLVTYHGRDVHLWWQRWMTKVGIGRSTRLYASLRLAEDNHDPYGLVVECGIDPAVFAPRDQRDARRELGIEHDEPVVLFGGFPANAEKGYDLFIDVLAEVRSRGVTVHELILAEMNQPRTRVAAKFNAADCMLFPSWINTEASPTVVKEAMMTGLPVVSTDVGDVREMLEGITPSAWVAFPQPWGTKPARARLVTELADHLEKILVSRMRSNGPEFRNRVDLESKAYALIDVYRQMIAGDAPGGIRKTPSRKSW